MSRASALIALVVFASACGGVQGPGYRGEPFATVKGQLSASDTVDTSRGVRLAIAWFPRMGSDDEPLSNPRGIITEDVIYRGSFPLNYEVSVYKPPPPEAFGQLEVDGQPARAALGVLMAYIDENENGQLDTIPPGGNPVDTVLGTSWELVGQNGYGLVYLDQSTPLIDTHGDLTLQPGFNLVSPTRVLPFSTPVPIPLTGATNLNLYVCQEAWSGDGSSDSACQFYVPQGLMLGASLELDDQKAAVNVSLFDWETHTSLPSAHVTIDGRDVPEASPGIYMLFDDTRTLLAPGGSYHIRAEPPDGGAPVEVTAVMPGEFSITSPAAGASLINGEAVPVSWSKSANAEFYKVGIDDPDGFSIVDPHRSDTEQFTTEPVSYSGQGRLSVMAVKGDGFTSSYASLTHSVPVTFGP